MSGLDNIIKEINDDARSVAEKIEAQAKKEADLIIDGAKKKAQEIINKTVAESEKESKSVIARATSRGEVIAKRVMLEEKQNIINATLKNTYESIMSLDIASYFMYMEKILSNRAEKKSGELIMSKRDKDNVTESFIKAAKEKGLSISPNTRDINGGFVLVYGDIEENFSIEDRMREKNDELCDVISNILF